MKAASLLADDCGALLPRIHDRLRAELDLRRNDIQRMPAGELRQRVRELAREIIARESFQSEAESAGLAEHAAAELLGFGPLEALLADDSISEIMVNGPGVIFIERDGRLQRLNRSFSSERALRSAIERMMSHSARRVDEASPMADARLPDGSRVNVILPPLAVRGPCVTIRKFASRQFSLDALVAAGGLSRAMADFLVYAVAQRRSMVIAGGTGSGKTTLLNAISQHIGAEERIVTIEDAAELRLQHGHVVSLEARPVNLEGKGEVGIRDLVRNALRMRPDRIIVGECRGGEALDMLQAMNTGHAGSLTTAHANSPRDLLARLEVMVLMAGMELPVAAIRAQIVGALDLVVQQCRFADGLRRVTGIVELTGLDSGSVQMQELFRFDRQPGRPGGGVFRGCGRLPEFAAVLPPGQRPPATLFDDPSAGGRVDA